MPHTPTRKREIRAAKKAAGICYFCPEAAVPDQVRCATHAAEAARIRRTRRNLVPSCTSCNTSKGDRLLDEWLTLRGVC